MTRSLEHSVLLYEGIGQYLATTAPYLRDGLEAGDAVFAVVPEPRLSALRDVLGRDGREVSFVDAHVFYTHPVRALQEYDRLVRVYAPRRLRVVGERVWSADDRTRAMAWIRYESLVNVAFAGSGARAICAYDRGAVSEEILDHARRTHPLLVDGRAPRAGNDAYEDPERVCDEGRRHPPPPDAEYLPFISDHQLYQVRRFVAARASRYGLNDHGIAALETAVTEAATNALKHGTTPMGVRVWTRPGEFVCEVADHGCWRPGPTTGFLPPASALERGFGLWSVRLLVDLVQLHAGWDGTFVRMHMRR